MAKSKKSKNIVSINWEEEEGGKFIKNPGEYIVEATSAELDEDDEGKQYITWSLQVVEGKAKGSSITTRTFITPKALWKLRELLECMGIEVGNSLQDLDLDETIEEGKRFVIEVEEGNERADGNGYYMTVSDYMSLEDYNQASSNTSDEEEEEPDEEEVKTPKKASKKSKKKEPEPEEDSEEEIDEDEVLDQMEDEIDELGLDIDLDDYDTFEEKVKAFEKAKKKASKKSSKKEEPDEEEESQQLYTVEEIEALGTKQLKVIAEEIGLELDEEASTRSKRRSVIAGLRKAGLLEE